jgi:hypothetical protein
MDTSESTYTNSIVNAHTEQPAAVPPAEEKDLTTNFYVVGGIINIVMISAYFIWAVRAWKKADKRKGR